MDGIVHDGAYQLRHHYHASYTWIVLPYEASYDP